MARTPFMGSRLRRLRKDKQLTQTDLAGMLGISTSYLNLIEHDRRDLTVPILLKLSQILNVDPMSFASNQDGQLLAEVTEALHDPLFAEDEYAEDSLSNFTSDQPEFARLLVKLYQSYKLATGDLQMLRERLSQDSLLAESSFRLRTLVTSIFSLTEIMHDNADLDEAERQRFLDIVLKDSTSLTDTVNEMLGFVGGDHLSGKELTPSPFEAVTDFVQANNNYFEDIERAAEEIRHEIGEDSPNLMELSNYLQNCLDVAIEYAPQEHSDHEITLYDDKRRKLTLSKALPPSTVKFHMALLIGQLKFTSLFDDLIKGRQELVTDQAQTKARDALTNYFAGACLFPYDLFHEAAERVRYDIEVLQQQFGASYEQICHRLTTLQKPEKSGIPFHLIRSDVAGNISKRFSASGLRIPRYGTACPRWVVHAALMTPNSICTQISELPDGSQFFAIAKTVTKPSMGYNQPKRHYAISLGCALNQAHRLVYADNINLTNPKSVMPVGITCRLCDRENCGHRAAPTPSQNRSQNKGPRNISPGIGDW
ncbi:DUF2083 domain-containing protein [Sneathiella sp. P13V-1]|uniref:helix-turn-helix domain-containing protein n=1 Tax=Sneathiella sp. P13V-1 TaxID=2697366 RepID=UPI00187B80D2|nr:XRE family transcriptional regulator [Sneathiella sp. P13V-1]MBE7638184.1 DUF2083 domain-containing protein [Sneathiella sp. P13V-1]